MAIETGMLGHWRGSITDLSGNGNDLVLQGGASFSGVGPISTPLVMDGTGDHALFPTINLPNDYTISMWVKGDSNNRALISKSDDSINYVVARPTYLEVKLANRKDYAQLIPSATEWQHFVIVDSDIYRTVYLNGQRIAQYDFVGSVGTLVDALGRDHVGDPNMWDGGMDDVRIYNKAITDDEAAELYELSGNTIDIPQTLLISGSAVDQSDLANTVTAEGNITFDKRGITGTSMILDGVTGTHLKVTGAPFLFDKQHHTVTMWYRSDTSAAVQSLIGNYVDNTQGWDLSIDAQFMKSAQRGSVSRNRDTFANNDKQWNHLAITFDSKGLFNFFNGVSFGGASGSYTPTISNTDLFIGSRSATDIHFSGQMDSIRVYDGLLTDSQILNQRETDILNLGQYNISCYGDSLVAGTGATYGKPFPSGLQDLLDDNITFNHGVGGRTVEDTALQVIADTYNHEAVLVLWDAYAVDCVTSWDSVINTLSTDKFIVIGCATTLESDVDVRATNTAQELAYGDQFIDIYQAMIDETGQNDYASFRSDGVHLNDEGYAFVASLVKEKLTELLLIPTQPSAPTIQNEDPDLKLFEFTPLTGCELSTDNGSTWSDQDSPYTVPNIDIPVGELQVRVKAEGINPASDITPSTIAYTELDTIDYTEIELYSRNVNGIDQTPVTVQLVSCSERYKDDLVIRREETAQTETPDSERGQAIFNLPDTDDMGANAKYEWRLSNGCVYHSKVQKSATRINFNQLEELTKISRY